MEIEKEKISVIIPVYNVEKYLKRCLDSVINQTYKNLEIILVDDGSTDSSGRICDEYAKKDKRIIIIHKENGGLSDARNKGLDICTGDYISFIDSDDWIEINYFEILLEKILCNYNDISCCDYLRTDKYITYTNFNEKIKIKECYGIDILKIFLEKELVSAWAKLFKKEIFEDLRFPIGKINEDIATIFIAFSKANRIVNINRKLYFYYKNTSSITKSKFTAKNLDLLTAWEEVVKLSKRYPENIQSLAEFRLRKAYFSLLGVIAYYGMEYTQENIEIKNYIFKKFKENYILLLKSNLISFNRKIAIICMRISFNLCSKIGSLIRTIKSYYNNYKSEQNDKN